MQCAMRGGEADFKPLDSATTIQSFVFAPYPTSNFFSLCKVVLSAREIFGIFIAIFNCFQHGSIVEQNSAYVRRYPGFNCCPFLITRHLEKTFRYSSPPNPLTIAINSQMNLTSCVLINALFEDSLPTLPNVRALNL